MKNWLQLSSKCNQLQPNPKIAVCKLLNVVARDGIEPPTPAFSGLDSTIRISRILFTLTPLHRVQNSKLLGPYWDHFSIHHSRQSRQLVHYPPL